MNRLYIILLVVPLFCGCKKTDTVSNSGTVTIDNTLYGTGPYYQKGFLFSRAAKVSTLDSPAPDIVVDISIDNPSNRLTFQANNLNPSFYKSGDYPDAPAAVSAFKALKTVEVSQWTDMADPIAVNQVWIYRSGNECYAKIRIISIVNETRNSLPYGECTFEWVYQPDGSLTFPGK